ncbi:hypothetical protein [uncultured Arcticibacterium sp.]|uniref:hypothetical protein n=1 Tax=uncultured Arcticibacterium sp. TaxID=2173042 RepID=UPI0030F89E40
MSTTKSQIFFYPSWVKFAGLALIVLAIGIFVFRIAQYGITDVVGLSAPVAFGLMMVFFSKEKIMDERCVFLKFKALAVSLPVTAVLVSAYNYSKNFNGYSIETDSWFSVSAFEALSVLLIIAIVHFYYFNARD